MTDVDFRCPVTPRRRFARLRDGVGEGQLPERGSGLLLDFKCEDCTRTARSRGRGVDIVTHQFTLTGEATTTTVRLRDGREAVSPLGPDGMPTGRGRRDDDGTRADRNGPRRHDPR